MLILVLCLSAGIFTQGSAATPAVVVTELLAADRGFGAAGNALSTIEALAAMFGDDITAPTQAGGNVQGKTKVVEALRANPDNLGSRVQWAPVRGGISADGLHGFTFGYMTVTKADGTAVPLKYLSYWIKGGNGWRVVAYRRRPRPAGNPSTEMMPPALPDRALPVTTDATVIKGFADSLAAAERAFSDEAQKIGIGAAFAKYGRPDAVNMGGPKDVGFVVGADAIGRSVGAGSPTDSSEVEWNADRVLVASSGDLGITFGMIRIKKPQPNGPAAVPFFTIWRRETSTGVWRYIAE